MMQMKNNLTRKLSNYKPKSIKRTYKSASSSEIKNDINIMLRYQISLGQIFVYNTKI